MAWFIAAVTVNGTDNLAPMLIYSSSLRSAFNKAKRKINSLAPSRGWHKAFLIVDSVTDKKANAIRVAEEKWRYEILRGNREHLMQWDIIKDYEELLCVIAENKSRPDWELQDEF